MFHAGAFYFDLTYGTAQSAGMLVALARGRSIHDFGIVFHK